MKIFLTDTPADPVRLAFLHVFNMREGMQNADGSKSPPKYEVTPIFRPDGANAALLREAIIAVAKEKYGEKPVKDGDGNTMPAYKAVLAEFGDDQSGIRKGNLKKAKDNSIYAGFEDMVYVAARTKTRPTVINRDRTPLVESDGVVYAGAYGNVQIDVWALAKPGMKKRIVTDLLGVQFTRDGDAFGSGSTPSDPEAFPDLAAGGEDSGGSVLD